MFFSMHGKNGTNEGNVLIVNYFDLLFNQHLNHSNIMANTSSPRNNLKTTQSEIYVLAFINIDKTFIPFMITTAKKQLVL